MLSMAPGKERYNEYLSARMLLTQRHTRGRKSGGARLLTRAVSHGFNRKLSLLTLKMEAAAPGSYRGSKTKFLPQKRPPRG